MNLEEINKFSDKIYKYICCFVGWDFKKLISLHKNNKYIKMMERYNNLLISEMSNKKK